MQETVGAGTVHLTEAVIASLLLLTVFFASLQSQVDCK